MTAFSPTAFIGCDVGKAEIVIFDSRTGRSRTLRNTSQALAGLARSLDDSCLVVCEATGGYEAELLDTLLDAGRAVHRADAGKVRAFIRSFGTLGKTDRIDARALALYGGERHARLALWQPRDAERDRLHRLVMLRRDLVAQHTAWGHRAAAPGATQLDRYIRPLLGCLAAEIVAIDADIASLIDSCASLRRDAEALCTIPGIGPRTAAALIGLMPNWDDSSAARRRPWPGWLRIRDRVGRAIPIAGSEAAGRRSSDRCSWPRWSPVSTIPSCVRSASG